MQIRFEIDHLDHTGALIETFRPLRLRWSYRLGNLGIGDISYQLALSDPLVTRDGFAAYATDWQLNMIVDEADSFPLHAGIHTGATLRNDMGVVDVAGLDWLHWLEQPYAGFNYVTPPTPTVVRDKTWSAAAGATQEDVVDNLIASLTDPAYDANGVWLVPDYSGASFAQTMDSRLAYADSASVLQLVRNVSHLYDPRGFDFWVDWDKTVRFVGPRAINPAAVSPAYTLTGSGQIVGIPGQGFQWNNPGPRATQTVGAGAGANNMRGISSSTYAPSVTQYRRWARIANLSGDPGGADLSSTDLIVSQAASQGYLDRFPQKELRIVVKPDAVDPADPAAFFFNQVGQALDITYDFPPYHLVDAFFFVTGQSFQADSAGNWLCDVTHDQIYT